MPLILYYYYFISCAIIIIVTPYWPLFAMKFRYISLDAAYIKLCITHSSGYVYIAITHQFLPLFLSPHLPQDKTRELYCTQLKSTSGPLHRIRLKVFGHQGVGKTTLIDSLKCGYLRGLFRRSKSNISSIGRSATKKYISRENLLMRSDHRSLSSLSTESSSEYHASRGIDIFNANIPGRIRAKCMGFC